jgi:tRNA(Ile)-lysidine synthase
MKDKFTSKVSEYISHNKLLDYDKHYIVALSGGADSTALLLVLISLGYNVCAAHCNFHLRGIESDRDENFCKDMCKRHNIDFHLAHFDTKTYASLNKVSIEMAARTLRYSYFNNLCNDLNFDGICVAHHRDDSVETVLLNIIRGTGFDGLTGIKPRNGIILRPLLCVNKSEILQFLNEEKQNYITDSTNLIDNIQRNKIRLDVLPLLRTINPQVDGNIALMSERMQDISKVLQTSIENSIKTCVAKNDGELVSINISKLLNEQSPEYVLWNILKKYKFNSTQINDIMHNISANSGKYWCTEFYEAIIDRNVILVKKRSNNFPIKLSIPEPGFYAINKIGHIRISFETKLSESNISRQREIATVDADKVTFPITLRKYIKGDRFFPYGMNGSKLVSDFLTDLKVNLFDKRSQLIIADATENIIWLVGRRTDERYAITKNTHTLLKIEMIYQ